ncbi:MAG: insulinase family protein [Caldithrix sp.]|nr:insulinase family protein [Caldithrix sp.]
MNYLSRMFVLFNSVWLIACAGQIDQSSKTISAEPKATDESRLSLDQTLPVDTKIIKGQLDNGLTYYIRKNSKPEDRAELRLVVDAGSILEEPYEQGLAHFVEHMSFNGTKHFQKQELIDYLESIGMRFGPEINAYTSFDETVYMLKVPTDSAEILEKGFLVLQDWANAVSFDDEEINKERGVVIEEWRLGRGAQQRMRDEQFPILFKNSRYADRLPIGKKSVLDTFALETPRQFYKKWYRPDLMAVVAVGDFDNLEAIKQKIQDHFGHLTNPQNKQKRTYYPVPLHEETYFAIASDEEATRSSVSVYYKMSPDTSTTVGEYRQDIIERLFNSILNQRLKELSQQENPPFIFAYSGQGQFVRTSEVYVLSAVVKDNGIPRGLEALLTEAKRVQQFGFTQSEMQRQKDALLRQMEKAYKERNKNESRRYAAEFRRNFLTGEPIPGIEYEYKLYQEFIPTIELDEVNQLATEWITEQNRVVMVDSPEKEGVEIPNKNDLQQVMQDVRQKEIVAYVDDVSNEPLLETVPKASEIVKTEKNDRINVTEWTLANGVKVVLKPTDFKNDQVIFSATSPGGYSLVDDDQIVAAKTADAIIQRSGVGTFSEVQLDKKLAGKVVSVNPYIDILTEGIKGQASPQDLETMFKLIYLHFTAPRMDSSAFAAFKTRMQAMYANRSASPEAAFSDSITAVITNHHPRFKPMNVDMLQQMDLKESFDIYRDRFSDAGDFTFYFVGNFDLQKIKPLVQTYLGGLPVTGRQEKWADNMYEYPQSIVEKTVNKGIDPKSYNAILLNGPFEWTPANKFKAEMMVEVLDIKLRERIREALGGTYGVYVRGRFSHWPKERYRITIYFGCNPERVEELTEEVFVQLDSLRQVGTTDKYLNKVKEIALRERETSLKQNTFWRNKLEFYDFHGIDRQNILLFQQKVENLALEDIQQAAQKYLKDDRYVHVVLYPENWDAKAKAINE